MNVLGLSGALKHNPSAALMIDTEIIAADVDSGTALGAASYVAVQKGDRVAIAFDVADACKERIPEVVHEDWLVTKPE